MNVLTLENACVASDFSLSQASRSSRERQRRSSSMHKSVSTPSLRFLGDVGSGDDGMEVFVVLRNFQEFAGGVFNKLPGPLRDGVRDCGICHYMTVFRSSDGTMTMFDFGPEAGGDIHVGRGPFAKIFNKSTENHLSKKNVRACVRENRVSSLPLPCMYVGRTNLSLSDIRAWNDVHASSEYELHRSDCRHYVNSLVHYSTGVEKATTSALRHQWAVNKEKYGVAGAVLRIGHYMTDVANWDRVKAVGNATAAVLAAVTGQQALARFKPIGLLRYPVRRALIQRPVYAVGTAAVATYAASNRQTPSSVRETIGVGSRIVSGVQTAIRAAAGIVERVGKNASSMTHQTTSQVVTLATGIAGAATRRASKMGSNRPKFALAERSSESEARILARGAHDHTNQTRGSIRAIIPAVKNDHTQRLAFATIRR